MATDDDDLMLNLSNVDPFSSSSKPKNKKKKPDTQGKQAQHQTKKNSRRNESDKKDQRKESQKPGKSGEKPSHQQHTGKPSDNKPFEFISSLFTKNPDIPEIQKTKSEETKSHSLFAKENSERTEISEKLIKTLKDRLGFEQFTKVQKLSIPVILSSKDVLIKSPTGSGKTLAYALPVVHKLQEIVPKINRNDGPYAVVLLPTRELALQSYQVFESICRTFVWIVPGLVVGGEKRKAEKSRIRKGINIIIATPGRLLDHLKATKSLTLEKVSFVVFDEADRLLDLGFEQTILSILSTLNEQSKSHQTALLSATLSPKVDNLASISLKDHVFIDATKSDAESASRSGDNDAGDDSEIPGFVMPDTLKQFFVIVPAKLRLVSLLSFLSKHAFQTDGKIIVFFSSKSATELHYKLLESDIMKKEEREICEIYRLHGDMQQNMRNDVFTKFKKCKRGVLLCTDVAARGLDLPQVNWIIQYSCPTQIDDYVHRVGRTARIGAIGKAVLFLLPSEVKYIDKLQEKDIKMEEIKIFDVLACLLPSGSKRKNQSVIQDAATDLQMKLEQLLIDSSDLSTLAEQAFKSYIQAYATYPASLKEIFHVKKLHLGHFAKSFGLRAAPQQMEKSVGGEPRNKSKKKSEKNRKRKITDMSESGGGLIMEGPRPGKKKKQKRHK